MQDEFRATKELLKDFNDGRILYVAPPEGLEGLDLAHWAKETEGTIFRNEKVSSRHERRRLRQVDEEEAALEGEVADLRVEEASIASTAKKPTREHKRLKTWVSWCID